MVTTIIVFGFILRATGITNSAGIIVTVITAVIASFYFQQFTSKGQVQLLISDTTIEVKYVRQSLFQKKNDRAFTFADIESYKYQPDKNFDLFKLTLRDHSTIYLYHDTTFADDDFEKLITDFPKLATDYNKKSEKVQSYTSDEKKQSVVIKREKTLFEGTTGLILAVFATIFIAVFIFLIIANKIKQSSGIFGLFASISGATFFLSQFLRYRGKENPERQ